jgi:hypothetical protein
MFATVAAKKFDRISGEVREGEASLLFCLLSNLTKEGVSQ